MTKKKPIGIRQVLFQDIVPLRKKEAQTPSVRRSIGSDSPEEQERWIAENISFLHPLPKPEPVTPSRAWAKIVYVGPPSAICGAKHRPVYDSASDSIVCAACKTKLTRSLGNA